jgi:hypothetical protein
MPKQTETVARKLWDTRDAAVYHRNQTTDGEYEFLDSVIESLEQIIRRVEEYKPEQVKP